VPTSPLNPGNFTPGGLAARQRDLLITLSAHLIAAHLLYEYPTATVPAAQPSL
jgi:hypothetical protein